MANLVAILPSSSCPAYMAHAGQSRRRLRQGLLGGFPEPVSHLGTREFLIHVEWKPLFPHTFFFNLFLARLLFVCYSFEARNNCHFSFPAAAASTCSFQCFGHILPQPRDCSELRKQREDLQLLQCPNRRRPPSQF